MIRLHDADTINSVGLDAAIVLDQREPPGP